MEKGKMGFLSVWYSSYVSLILVCDWYDCSGIQTVCEITEVTKIGNSGVQIAISGNLVWAICNQKSHTRFIHPVSYLLWQCLSCSSHTLPNLWKIINHMVELVILKP